MLSFAHRSASQYQVKVHSAATTSPSRYGAMMSRSHRVRLHVAVYEDLTRSVENADVHRAGVEIDAAVVTMLSGVKSHGSSSCADVRALTTAVQATQGRVAAGGGLDEDQGGCS